jgi:putative ABC transport system ATP-binding protein
MIISLENINLKFQDRQIFKNFSLKIDTSEKTNTVLIGGSGSGKTSLISLIAGLSKQYKGNIFYDGIDIKNLTSAKIDKFRGENIGIIFQKLHLIKSLSVKENILIATHFSNKSFSSENLNKFAEKIGIVEKLNKMPSELSLGEAQRVAILRSVINRPKLILADEPTSSLDDKNADSVINFLFDLANEVSASVILSTHDSRIKSLKLFNKKIEL